MWIMDKSKSLVFCVALGLLFLVSSSLLAQQDAPATHAETVARKLAQTLKAPASEKSGSKDDTTDAAEWSVDAPPGPTSNQQIDVTEGTWLTVDVSPDGKEIVFDLLGDLYAMPITGADGTDGRFPEKLTSGVAWDMQPRFSHNGQWIAFTSDRNGKGGKAGDNIWVMDRKSKEVSQVSNETYRLLNGPAWSHDDTYIVARKHFTSRRSLGAGEMWMYHRDAASLNAMAGVQLTKRPNDQKDVNEPIFSPDGKYLYYSQDSTPGNTFEYDKDSNGQIYTIKRLDFEKGETEAYITGPGGSCRPTPSPDGKLIAFVRRVGSKTGLHVFDTESGSVRLVYDRLERDMQEAWAIHGVYSAFAWMPDGKSIVTWAKGKIRRISIDDGTEKIIPFHIKDTRAVTKTVRFPVEVAPDQFDVKMLRWVRTSPNGKQVVYQALGHIYLRDLPNGVPRRLTARKGEFEFCPSWSRDGKHIVYTTWNDQQLGSIRLASIADKQNNRQVTVRPGHYVNPAVSPDGSTIVFEKSSGGRLRSPLYSHDPGVYTIPATGGRPKRIAKSGSRPQFGANSKRVFLQRLQSEKEADNRKLYSIDLSGNEERVHYSSQWASDYRVSPDGKLVAFVERFNVYVAPFVKTGSTINIGPKFQGLPIRKLSSQAGDWIHFSGDSQWLHWTLGPQLFTSSVNPTAQDQEPAAKTVDKKPDKTVIAAAPKDDSDDADDSQATSVNIGFRSKHAKPQGSFALVGGRIVTMGPAGIIEDGVILVESNRIKAVGSAKDIKVPGGVRIYSIKGRTVIPGFVDTHAHGAQATLGITPQRNWVDYARLSFGVTTVHDPSNDTQGIFAASEMTKAGRIVAPRTFSTGTILYGATGSYRAEINSQDDALFHLKRMKAVGAFSVKSYNQPRRDQRQQVIAAARELKMMVVPEGGSTFMHNMTMIVDGHTGIEHTLPVQTAYDDVMDLWRNTGVGYTPTLSVAYGGISGERFWYAHNDLWLHPRLKTFIPPHVLNPRSKRREISPLEDYNHIRVAEIAKQLVDDGGLVQAGGHGQLNGICTHWELWSFVQGGMTPLQSLQCGTINGAKYVGLDGDIGSLEVGKLADMLVMEEGADPTKRIRDSERIHLTIANGRIFNAETMSEFHTKSQPEFYWKQVGAGISYPLPHVTGCSCQRSGL
jgi:Tol biopolymer transport system component/imidazolonepropionase-like amidohydrolase